MILTVTVNSALDRIFFIDEWLPGKPMRTDKIVTAVGGKGLDTSVSLSCQGVKSTGLAFVAGDSGKELIQILDGYGVQTIPIWVGGETRVAHVVAERRNQRHSHLIAGNMEISGEHVQEFFETLENLAKQASWVVTAGSLPQGFNSEFTRQIIEIAKAAGAAVLVDPSNTPIIAALPARPTILKLNKDEFEANFAVKLDTKVNIWREGSRVKSLHNLENLVITCGKEGIFAITSEGNFMAVPPPQIVINAAGAGDSVSGVLPHRLSLGASWPEALRWAAAVSAATVLTEATAECRMEDVMRILPDVEVTNISAGI